MLEQVANIRRFLNLLTTDIWVLQGTIKCNGGWLVPSLTSACQMWAVHPQRCNLQTCLQTLPNIPLGQNHPLLRITVIWQQNWILLMTEYIHPNIRSLQRFKAQKKVLTESLLFKTLEELLFKIYLKNHLLNYTKT